MTSVSATASGMVLAEILVSVALGCVMVSANIPVFGALLLMMLPFPLFVLFSVLASVSVQMAV